MMKLSAFLLTLLCCQGAWAGEVQFRHYEFKPPKKFRSKKSEAAWGHGFEAMKAKDWGKCAEKFKEASSLEKESFYKATAMYNQGFCVGRSGKKNEGRELMEKAVKMEMSLEEPMKAELSSLDVSAAMEAIDKNDLSGAEKLLKDALKKSPDNFFAHSELAFVYSATERFEDCLKSAAKSAELEPKYPNPLATRGGCWIHLGKYDEALADLDKALAIDPRNYAVLINRAMANAKKGDCAQACKDAAKAIGLNPQFREYFREPVNNCRFGL